MNFHGLGLSVFAFLAFAALAGAVTNVTACGQAIDVQGETYELNTNISSGNACLVISANSVTLDCKGHSITYGAGGSVSGIYSNGYSGLTIKNCNIYTSQNAHGIRFENTNGDAIIDNNFTITGQLFVISMSTVDSSVVSGNRITMYGKAGQGVVIQGTISNVTVENNVILANETGNTAQSGGFGINFAVPGSCAGVAITGNTVITYTNINFNSLVFQGCSNSSITHNNVTNYASQHNAIILTASSNWNNITDNIILGYASSNDYSISLDGSGHNTVARNTISVSGDSANPIWLGTASYNAVVNNTMNTTGANSWLIYVGPGAELSTLSYNRLFAFGDSSYGLYSQASSNNVFSYNNMTATGASSYGFASDIVAVSGYGSSTASALSQNNFNLSGDGSWGVYLTSSSGINLSSNTIAATGSGAYGVYLESTANARISDNTLSAPTKLFSDSASDWAYSSGGRDITFPTATAFSGDLDSAVYMSGSVVAINSTAYPSLNTSATVSLNFSGACPRVNLYYYGQYSTSLAEIVANGQPCSSTSTPACTLVSCSGNTVTFSVPHFDSYGGQGYDIPEFSPIAALAALLLAAGGYALARKRK